MKHHSDHWYKLLAAASIFLLLVLFYRREAHLRAYINNMEARITALENYNQGLIALNRSSSKPDEPTEPSEVTKSEKTYRSASKKISEHSYNANTENAEHTDSPRSTATVEHQSEDYSYSGKFQEIARQELNTIDSATLVRIPGIGEGTARSILQYRRQLGGFYSPEQLREKLTWEYALPYLDIWCNDWFWADEQFVQKLKINQLSFKELLRHPYLNYEEVKALVKWRDRHGKINGVSDLEQLGVFTPEKLDKLLHYVEF